MSAASRALRGVPPPRPADTPPAAPSSAAGGPPSLSLGLTPEVAAVLCRLTERMAKLERDVAAGGLERKIPLEEIAARLNHAPSTLRAWAKDPAKTASLRLDLLLVVSPLPSREVYTTPRLLAQWEDHVRGQWTRVLYGAGLRAGERLVGANGR